MVERDKPRKLKFIWVTIVAAGILVLGVISLAFFWPGNRQDLWGLGTVLLAIVLSTITAIYVFFTKELLESERERDLLSYSPFVGINVTEIEMQERYIRVKTSIRNGGNAPAIDVRADAEIALQVVNIQGESNVPAHFPSNHIPYITDDNEETTIDFLFGPITVDAVKQDIARALEFGPTKPIPKRLPDGIWQRVGFVMIRPELRIIIFYRNHLKQYFQSVYKANITIKSVGRMGEPMLSKDEMTNPCVLLGTNKVEIWGNPPIFDEDFTAEPVAELDVRRQLESRDMNRDIGGFCMPCIDTMPILFERTEVTKQRSGREIEKDSDREETVRMAKSPEEIDMTFLSRVLETSNDWIVRNNAVVGLGLTNDKKAIALLIKALNDRDCAVQNSAVISLVVHGLSAVGHLRDVSSSKEYTSWVRQSASRAMELINDKYRQLLGVGFWQETPPVLYWRTATAEDIINEKALQISAR